MITYDEIPTSACADLSGVDNPREWLWDDNSLIPELYYPVEKIELPTEEKIIEALIEEHGEGLSREGAKAIIWWSESMGDPVTLDRAWEAVHYMKEYTKEEMKDFDDDAFRELVIPLPNGNTIVGNW